MTLITMAQIVLFIKNNILEFISITPHLCDIKVLPTQSYRYRVSITLATTQCAVVFLSYIRRADTNTDWCTHTHTFTQSHWEISVLSEIHPKVHESSLKLKDTVILISHLDSNNHNTQRRQMRVQSWAILLEYLSPSSSLCIPDHWQA